jgi:hypothetical protein
MTDHSMKEIKVQQHFVVFYSPGTFVAETTEKPIDAWNIDDAVAMAALITERYGAKPYGFRFTTRGRGPDDLDSKEIAKSPMHYIGGKVETLEEIEARNDPREEILRSNMLANGYERVWTTTEGWKWTQPLQAEDVVLTA